MKILKGWHIKRIKDIANVIAGGTPSTSKAEFWGGDIPWMNSGELNLKNVRSVRGRITKEGFENSSTKLIKKHAVLVGLAGQGKTRGTAAVNEIDLCINQSIGAIQLLSSENYYKYVFYNIDSRYSELRQLSSGDGGRGGLNISLIEGLKILLPTLAEQKAISEFLSTYDSAIEKTERLIRLKEEYKKSVMQNIVSGFIGSARKIKEIAEIDTNTLSKNTDPMFRFKYITLSDVERGRINDNLTEMYFKDSPSRARNRIKKGDIIFGTVRPNLQSFARIRENTTDTIVSTGFSVITPKKEVEGEYVYQLLFTNYISRQIDALIVGSSYPAINSEEVGNLKMPLPSFAKQKKIGDLFVLFDRELLLLNQKMTILKLQKKGLMQQLLTGKIRVNVKEDPPSPRLRRTREKKHGK